MTGRYSNRVGVWHTVMGRSQLRAGELTMAEIFKDAGYRTGIFGKWHLGDNVPFRAMDQGFETSVTHGGGGIGQIPDFWDNDYFDDTYSVNGKLRSFQGFCTDIWFSEALKFIGESTDAAPFFCYISTNAPHSPFRVEQRFAEPYLDAGIDTPRARFYGMIANIDWNVGRLLDRLDEVALAKNTILIFMTDNGTSAGVTLDEDGFESAGFNAEMRGKKGSEFEGGHRVPFFIRWPEGGLFGEREINTLTAHIDVLPTLIELCELDVDKAPELDGISLAPLLLSETGIWPDRVLITDSQRVERPVKWRKSAVMTERWRLINGSHLFDFTADPGQRTDIAEQFPDVVDELRLGYEEWWDSVSASFNRVPRTIVGRGLGAKVWLTSHDWHNVELDVPPKDPMAEVNPPWNQNQVREGVLANGTWSITVETAGMYKISLRRWPEEARVPIGEAAPPPELEAGDGPLKISALQPVEARIGVAGTEISKPVTGDELEVAFRVQLGAGDADLKTWFLLESGESLGAYYASIERLSDTSLAD